MKHNKFTVLELMLLAFRTALISQMIYLSLKEPVVSDNFFDTVL
jgi:hypothetical protein